MVNVRVRGYKIAREPSGPSSSILCHIAGIVRQSGSRSKGHFLHRGEWSNQVCHLHLRPIRRPFLKMRRPFLNHKQIELVWPCMANCTDSCELSWKPNLQSPKVILEKRKSCQIHWCVSDGLNLAGFSEMQFQIWPAQCTRGLTEKWNSNCPLQSLGHPCLYFAWFDCHLPSIRIYVLWMPHRVLHYLTLII